MIVGVEHYKFLAPVAGATDNAIDWETYFTEMRGIPRDRVQRLTGDDATDYGIERAVKAAAKAVQPGGKLWFVFIGHGAPTEAGDDGLLVTVDAQQTVAGLNSRSVRHSKLLEWLGDTRGQAIAIIDACYSGRKGDGGSLIGTQPSRPVQVQTPTNILLLTAARHDQFAGPLPGAERPAFSYLLLGALRGWGDENLDGQVTGEEAIAYTRRALARLVRGSRGQEPTISGAAVGLALVRGTELGPDLDHLRRAIEEGLPYKHEWRDAEIASNGPPAAAALPQVAAALQAVDVQRELPSNALQADESTAQQPYALAPLPESELNEKQQLARDLSLQAEKSAGSEAKRLYARVLPMARQVFLATCRGPQASPAGKGAFYQARNAALALGDSQEVERLSVSLREHVCTFGGQASVASVDCRDAENANEPWCLATFDLGNLAYGRAVNTFRQAEQSSSADMQRALYEQAASALVAAVDDHPGHPQAALALEKAAIALERVSRFESAAELYARIVREQAPRKGTDAAQQAELDVIVANAQFRLAYNANRFGDATSALAHYRTLADSERFQRSSEPTIRQRIEAALINSARILEHLQRYAEAATYYERAAKMLQHPSERMAARYRVAEMSFKQERCKPPADSPGVKARLAS